MVDLFGFYILSIYKMLTKPAFYMESGYLALNIVVYIPTYEDKFLGKIRVYRISSA